jgi:hypothetical protein
MAAIVREAAEEAKHAIDPNGKHIPVALAIYHNNNMLYVSVII